MNTNLSSAKHSTLSLAFSRGLILAIIALLALPTQAALIEANDGTIGWTSDTDTGLDWLDLTETLGLSYDNIEAGTSVTFVSSGDWRYATESELSILFDNAGFTKKDGSNWAISTEIDAAVLFVDLFGSTHSDTNYTYAKGRYIPDSAPSGDIRVGDVHYAGPSTGASTGSSGFGSFMAMSDPNAEAGSFLVRNSSHIPAPGSLGLLVFAALVLVVRQLKRSVLS